MKEQKEFDMEEYIGKRMLEIQSLEERMQYKEIVGNLLKELYRYNEKAYEELEDRIRSESIPSMEKYFIDLTITDRQHYDATDQFMFPMKNEDVQKTQVSYEDIKSALETKEEIKLYTIFFETKTSEIRKILASKKIFSGVIKTENREYKAEFILKQNREYLDQITELYHIFVANAKPWTTVCTAYLSKFLDVYLHTVEEMKDKESITEIWIDFDEYNSFVHNDIFPLWNLKEIREKTSTYPEPGIHRVNYEHPIFAHRLKDDCEYLVMNTDIEITNVRRCKGDLIITCPVEYPYTWKLYQINTRKDAEKYLYPVLSNRYKDSFTGNITEMYKKSIKTRAEMERLLEAFPYREYMKFKDCKIMTELPQECRAINYDMDEFILDEIRIEMGQKSLVIEFEVVHSDFYLNEDIMNFLVAQVQKIFPEYRCVGKI